MSDTALIVSLVKKCFVRNMRKKVTKGINGNLFDHLCFAQHFYSRDVIVSKFEAMFYY